MPIYEDRNINQLPAAELSGMANGGFVGTDANGNARKVKGDDLTPAQHLKVVSNSEYVYAIVDGDDVFLFGVKADGSVEWSDGVPTPIKSFISDCLKAVNDAIATNTFDISSNSAAITNLQNSKQNAVDGRGLVVNEFADNTSIETSPEYVYALLDANGFLLFAIRKDGSVCSEGINSLIEYKLGRESGFASKGYVDAEVTSEKTRAENAEAALQSAINAIQPTIIEGGSNNPDEVFLTEKSGAVTIKDKPVGLFGLAIKYLRPGDSFAGVVTETNTIYVIRFPFELGITPVAIPSGCILRFDGGSIYGGTIIGNETKIEYTKNIIGSNVVVQGTWNVPYIRSDMLCDTSTANALKLLNNFVSSENFNVVHILNGQYTFTPEKSSDSLIAPKSNTKVIIDGKISVTPNAFDHYFIVLIADANNVEVTGNGELVGDADNHDYDTLETTHEHCHGIYISYTSAKVNDFKQNFFIHGLTIHGFPGDGVDAYGKNITIRDLNIYHCGRQGISIENSKNVVVENCAISDIYRTAPMAAIDVEPWNTSILHPKAENVFIRNVTISGCKGVMVFTSENVVCENVRASSVSSLVYVGATAKNSVFRNFKCSESSANIFRFISGCEACIEDFIVRPNDSVSADLSNCFMKSNCDFGGANVVGSPKAGSIKYTDGKYVQYNGTDWVNMDGSNLQ